MRIDSIIDYVTEHPEAIPPGWEMVTDDCLADDNECVQLYDSGPLDPDGTFTIAEEYEGLATEYGTSVEHRLMARIWTDDVGLAICLARAASAYQMAEVNPGMTIEIRARRD